MSAPSPFLPQKEKPFQPPPQGSGPWSISQFSSLWWTNSSGPPSGTEPRRGGVKGTIRWVGRESRGVRDFPLMKYQWHVKNRRCEAEKDPSIKIENMPDFQMNIIETSGGRKKTRSTDSGWTCGNLEIRGDKTVSLLVDPLCDQASDKTWPAFLRTPHRAFRTKE